MPLQWPQCVHAADTDRTLKGLATMLGSKAPITGQLIQPITLFLMSVLPVSIGKINYFHHTLTLHTLTSQAQPQPPLKLAQHHLLWVPSLPVTPPPQ